MPLRLSRAVVGECLGCVDRRVVVAGGSQWSAGASSRQLFVRIPVRPAIIGFAREHFPGLPQVACFDTTFHAGLPDIARVLPIAKELQFTDYRANRLCANLQMIYPTD